MDVNVLSTSALHCQENEGVHFMKRHQPKRNEKRREPKRKTWVKPKITYATIEETEAGIGLGGDIELLVS